jgi:hypothetical protein
LISCRFLVPFPVLQYTRFLSVSFWRVTPAVVSAQSLNEVVSSTLAPWLPGMVVAVERQHSMQFFETGMTKGGRRASRASRLSQLDRLCGALAYDGLCTLLGMKAEPRSPRSFR